MKRKKLLIILPCVPHPTLGASSVVFYYYIEALKQEGFSILNIVLIDGSESENKALADYASNSSELGSDFRIISAESKKFIQRQHGQFILDMKPLEYSINQANQFEADVIVAFDLLSAWLAKHIQCAAKVAWLGDLNFQTTWFHSVCKAKENFRFAIKLPSAWKRAVQWKKVYREILVSFQTTIVSSYSSIEQLEKLGVSAIYHPYPWPTIGASSKEISRSNKEIPRFLFCGGLDALGSKSALLFLINELYVQLKKQWGDKFQLLIAGRGQPPSWVHNAIAARPEIKFLGFVEDLDSVMVQCHAMLVPIDIPVGNRCRIVTAMSKGWPIIAHNFVSAGNPALIDGKTCFLADNAKDFARKMQWVKDNPVDVGKILATARESYSDFFAPQLATRGLLEIISTF